MQVAAWFINVINKSCCFFNEVPDNGNKNKMCLIVHVLLRMFFSMEHLRYIQNTEFTRF